MNIKTLSVQVIHFIVALLVSSEAFALEYNINNVLILDRINDTNWKLSATNLTNWFEYFDNTSQLTGNRLGSCSEIISNSFNNLDKADGIWIACDNAAAPVECDMSSCYPEITIPKGLINLSYVKIRIALFGFATLRFNVGSCFCIDYSYRKDPMSRCQFVEILPQLEWVDAEISTDDNLNFRTFSIQLLPRFKGDAVLVDKVEAFEYFPSRNPFESSNSTVSTVSTTIFPTTIYSDETFSSILDIESDANLPVDYQWELPDTVPKWMEYYVDYQHFLEQRSNTTTCANLISSQFTNRNLPNVPGIWSSCRKSIDCDSNPSSCHPTIYYKSPDEHYIYSIKSKFYLQNTSMLRLYAGFKCWDFKLENVTTPPCTLIRIPQLGDRWHSFVWTAQIFMPNQRVTEFGLELISQSSADVVLLDIIEVQYKKCENLDECSFQPTSPPDPCSTPTSTAVSSVSTTIFPSSTYSDGTFSSVLDIESDASLLADYRWRLPNLVTKWMEYYVDYQNFLDQRSNTTTCANLISPQFTSRTLPNVPGIWSNCRKSIDCDSKPSLCHPTIHYETPEEHYIYSIKSKFYLQNTSMLRLYAGFKCWDFKLENVTTPPCTLIRIPQLGDRWHDFYWTGPMFLPNQQAMGFRLELISRSSVDVVLLDRIEVQYKKCESIDECLPQTTYPSELTSTDDPATTEEGTTTRDFDGSTTTEQSEVTDATTITSETDATTITLETDAITITLETDAITITSETDAGSTDVTEFIESTTTTDEDETIGTTRITRTTTHRSGSSAGPIINTISLIIAFVVTIV